MAERGPIQDVNIELGDEMSKMLYEASKATHANRPGLLREFHESFSGARAIPFTQFPDAQNLYMNVGFDGVGTKVEVAERTRDHSTVAFDLFAMVCDDAVVRGAEPVALGSILDVRQLNPNEATREAMEQLAHGYVEAAADAGVVVVNGEIAELGDRIGGYRIPIAFIKRAFLRIMRQPIPDNDFNYNWGASVLWVAHKDRLLTGEQIEPGDSVVGLAENGFRSNGITDVRKAMQERYGKKWHDKVDPELGDTALGELVQRPSTIYSKYVTSLTGGYDINKDPRAKIHGFAHITGGGQPSKLGRMLEPSGHGVVIDEPIDPPEIMRKVQEIRGFSDEKAYGKWHMGIGGALVTPDPDTVIAEAEAAGIHARRIGQVVEEPGIHIKNRGARADDDGAQEYLHFPSKS